MEQRDSNVNLIKLKTDFMRALGYNPKHWTQSNRFNFLIGGVIFANAVALGLEADYGRTHADLFYIAENIFCVLFLLELLLHFYVEGPRVYFKDRMNWLDFGLVVLTIADVWVIRLAGLDAADMKLMSVFRMLRLLRLVRILRLFRIFKELTLIVV